MYVCMYVFENFQYVFVSWNLGVKPLIQETNRSLEHIQK